MATKSNLENLSFHHISAVDNPAVEDAQAVIMKRREQVRKDHLSEVFTSVEEGHQHGISIESWDNKIHVYVQSAKMQEEEGYGHSHAIIVQDGEYMLAVNAGHTHALEQDALRQAMLTRAGISKEGEQEAETGKSETVEPTQSEVDKAGKDDKGIQDGAQRTSFTIDDLSALKDLLTKDDESEQVDKTEAETVSEPVHDPQKQENVPMTTTQTESQPDGAGEVMKLQTENEFLRAVVNLEKTHRDFYNQLPASDQRTFANKSRADRESQIIASRESDPVVYRTDEGIEIRKSEGAVVLNLAKSNDSNARENRELREARERDVLEKRADNEIGHLSGEVDTRVALLKAIDGIEDETTRNNVLATIKSHDGGISAALNTYGHLGEGQPADAEQELDRLAKNLASEKDLTYQQAYTQAANTKQGRELYAQMQD